MICARCRQQLNNANSSNAHYVQCSTQNQEPITILTKAILGCTNSFQIATIEPMLNYYKSLYTVDLLLICKECYNEQSDKIIW